MSSAKFEDINCRMLLLFLCQQKTSDVLGFFFPLKVMILPSCGFVSSFTVTLLMWVTERTSEAGKGATAELTRWELQFSIHLLCCPTCLWYNLLVQKVDEVTDSITHQIHSNASPSVEWSPSSNGSLLPMVA